MTNMSPEAISIFLMLSAVFGAFAIKRWGRSRGKTSPHASDTSLDDVAISAIGGLFDSRTAQVWGGAQTWRPTWGARLIVPTILVTLLINIDTDKYLAGASAEDIMITQMFLLAAGGYLLFQWVMMLFVHRVIIDGPKITSYGYSLRPQTRAMADVTGIEVHAKTRLLTLHFKGAKPLHAPRFLSNRATFTGLIEAQIRENMKLHHN